MSVRKFPDGCRVVVTRDVQEGNVTLAEAGEKGTVEVALPETKERMVKLDLPWRCTLPSGKPIQKKRSIIFGVEELRSE